MNKETLIDKIAFISEELQQQTINWIRKDYEITSLEVNVYLSNIKYLSEQANYLNDFLLEEGNTIQATSINSKPVSATQSMEDLSMKIEEEVKHIPTKTVVPENTIHKNVSQPDADSLSLHEKLSEQSHTHSVADSLKQNYFQKDLSFSLNERLFIVSNLFDDDQNDFAKVTAHLATLDSWEEVEFYLNETCVRPYRWNEKEADKNHFYKILKQRFA